MNVDTEKEPREFLRQLEKLHSQIQGLSTTLKFYMPCIFYSCRDSTMNPDMAKAAAKMYFVVHFSVFRNEIIEKIRVSCYLSQSRSIARFLPPSCSICPFSFFPDDQMVRQASRQQSRYIPSIMPQAV